MRMKLTMGDNQKDRAILETVESQFENKRGSIKQYEELILKLTDYKFGEIYANLLVFKIAALVNYSNDFMKDMSKEEIVISFISELAEQGFNGNNEGIEIKDLFVDAKEGEPYFPLEWEELMCG